MKLTKAGLFAWSPQDGVTSSGWVLDMEGRHSLPDESEVLALMLNHIASLNGVTLALDPQIAEAMTEEALAKMRREGEV